jgi:hypothetical protein
MMAGTQRESGGEARDKQELLAKEGKKERAAYETKKNLNNCGQEGKKEWEKQPGLPAFQDDIRPNGPVH